MNNTTGEGGPTWHHPHHDTRLRHVYITVHPQCLSNRLLSYNKRNFMSARFSFFFFVCGEARNPRWDICFLVLLYSSLNTVPYYSKRKRVLFCFACIVLSPAYTPMHSPTRLLLPYLIYFTADKAICYCFLVFTVPSKAGLYY